MGPVDTIDCKQLVSSHRVGTTTSRIGRQADAAIVNTLTLVLDHVEEIMVVLGCLPASTIAEMRFEVLCELLLKLGLERLLVLLTPLVVVD